MMDVRKYLCAWKLDEDFIKQIDSFHVWSNDPANKKSIQNGLFVTKGNEVYAVGDLINKCYRSKFSDPEKGDDLKGLFRPVLLETLSHKRIKKFTFTFSHVFMCTKEGEVWGYGRYKDKKEVGFKLPNKVSQLSGKRVVDIAAGLYDNSILVLTDEGEVLHWILMQSRAFVSKFILTTWDSKPMSLFPGSQLISFFILLENGKVIKAARHRQELVHFHNATDDIECKIVKMACGLSHALFVSEDGRLFVTGDNSEAQLGFSRKKEVVDNLEQNNFFTEKVVDIAATTSCSLSAVMTESRKVYMFGKWRGVTVFKPILTSCSSLQEVFFLYSVPLITYKPMKVIEQSVVVHEPVKPVERSIEMMQTDFLRKIMNGPSTLNDVSENRLPDSAVSVEKFCDLTLAIEGKMIPVHKAVLALRSEHFAEMFQQNSSEEPQRVLEIEEGNLKLYKAFLKYIYTDQIENASSNEIAELFSLANKYRVKTLAEQCSTLMQPTITIENVVSLYESVAVPSKDEKMNLISEKLKKLCVEFTVKNEKAVIQSEGFKKMNSDMAKNLILEVFERRSF